MAKSATDIERDIRAALAGCAVDARGLWHEMRYLIEQHQRQEGGRPGHLQRNGKPLSDGQLALAAGCPSDAVPRLLQELVDVGLIELSGGCWVAGQIARMEGVRRRHNESERRSASRKVSDVVSDDTHPDTGSDTNLTIRPLPPSPPLGSPPTTPSYIPPLSLPPPVSSGAGETGDSAGRSRKPAALPPPPPALASSPVFMAAWRMWIQHRRELRKTLTPLAVEQQFAHMLEIGPERAAAAINHSIAQGYRGIFERPDEQTKRSSGHGIDRNNPTRPAAFTGARRPLPLVADPAAS